MTVMAAGPLHGQLAVVTGGATSLGRAVALALSDAGARVCVFEADPRRVLEEDRAVGAERIVPLPCDLGSVSAIAGAIDFIERLDEPVNIVVHAAAVHMPRGVTDGEVADLDEHFLINLRAPYVVTRQLLPLVPSGGHVVFLHREPGHGPSDTQFAMVQAGISELSNRLSEELAPSGRWVSTVHVSPGVVSSEGIAPGAIPAGDVASCVLAIVTATDRSGVVDLRIRPRTASQVGATQ